MRDGDISLRQGIHRTAMKTIYNIADLRAGVKKADLYNADFQVVNDITYAWHAANALADTLDKYIDYSLYTKATEAERDSIRANLAVFLESQITKPVKISPTESDTIVSLSLAPEDAITFRDNTSQDDSSTPLKTKAAVFNKNYFTEKTFEAIIQQNISSFNSIISTVKKQPVEKPAAAPVDNTLKLDEPAQSSKLIDRSPAITSSKSLDDKDGSEKPGFFARIFTSASKPEEKRKSNPQEDPLARDLDPELIEVKKALDTFHSVILQVQSADADIRSEVEKMLSCVNSYKTTCINRLNEKFNQYQPSLAAPSTSPASEDRGPIPPLSDDFFQTTPSSSNGQPNPFQTPPSSSNGQSSPFQAPGSANGQTPDISSSSEKPKQTSPQSFYGAHNYSKKKAKTQSEQQPQSQPVDASQDPLSHETPPGSPSIFPAPPL